MRRKEKSTVVGRHFYHLIVPIFLTTCFLIGVVCFQYYKQLQITVKAESGEYLQEISKQIGTNVSRTINDNFAVLGTIVTVIKNAGVTSYEELQPIIQEQQSNWNYQDVLMIGMDGVAYDAYGRKATLSGDQYLRDAVVNRERSMSVAQVINEKECIIFTIPMENITIGGKKMVTLAASYELNTFDQMISMTAFDGKGYSHIIRKDGGIVIRSSSESAEQFGYNILSTLEWAQMEEGCSLKEMKRDIADGQGGQIGFTMNGVNEYMAYTPLETEEWCLVTFVPVSVVNTKSELFLKITMLICTIITLLFAMLLVTLMISFYRHKKKLEQIAYVDPVTGGNTIQRFYEQAGERLALPNKPQYALVYMNIEKFKVLNEQFGHSACDGILRGLDKGINAGLNSRECMGRLFADNFCVLIEYKDEVTAVGRFEEWHSAAVHYLEDADSVWLPLTVEFGVYVIGYDTISFPLMIDRAKISLRETKRELRGKLRYAIYDEEMRKQIFREKQLEDMMEEALKNGEYLVYLQPKYHTQSEQIVGAEALVRWSSGSEGMIYPDEFISLFERNGFIIQLDLWVFEQVCLTIRAWLDAGLQPVKISVNCSRVHLRNPHFLDKYKAICERSAIPPNFIEMELTENMVFEDVEFLTKTIEDIHALGFGCAMDDFGSGYSSLNLIQDIPVDTLKLDKIFFRNGKRDLKRTESVVGSIIAMSKALSMKTVAEGVEEQSQLEMLKRLGCDYIQGYYFARPMPITKFEQLTYGTSLRSKEEA